VESKIDRIVKKYDEHQKS